MASEVEICNLALSHLGDSATVASIDPPEGSSQAEHCAHFYPIARNSLLEMHDWNFATLRITLAELSNPFPEWRHAYLKPAEALRVIAVLPAGSDGANVSPATFVTETNSAGEELILTNQPCAVARYTRVVTDASRFSPLFVDALGWYLSTYLAGPVLKGDTAIKVSRANMEVAMGMLAQAKLSAANQQRQEITHSVPWLAGR